ncbi:MAG TPA: 50S ribosomal protein L9 [Candidatus Paceibacterota bacterium]|nr:50S ribosomal protein L9 [Candidatus Paceibacterota bacterium]
MRVVLRQDIRGIGKKGDVKEIADGHVKNLLLPKGLVEPATTEALARVAAHRTKISEEAAARNKRLETLARELAGAYLEFDLRTDAKGTVFGSVTKEMILKAMRAKGWIRTERVEIELPHPLKAVGDYSVPIELAPEKKTTLTVRVRSQE